jgi:hypothetical protein
MLQEMVRCIRYVVVIDGYIDWDVATLQDTCPSADAL